MNRSSIFILAGFLTFLCSGGVVSARDFTLGGIHFEQAIEFKKQGNFVEAERHLKKALDVEPANADYHFELANVYAMKYDHYSTQKTSPQQSTALSAAARELEQTLMLNPDSIEASFNLGVVYKKQGKYEAARDKFRQVLEIHPQLVNAHLQIGSTYEEQGFFDDAKDSYLKARELDFSNPSIQSSIEDLKFQKARDQERMDAEYWRERYFRRRGLEFAPGSKSRQYYIEDQRAADQNAGLLGAIPYLSTWLAQQFMQSPADQV